MAVEIASSLMGQSTHSWVKVGGSLVPRSRGVGLGMRLGGLVSQEFLTVCEYSAGTGAFTRAICEHASSRMATSAFEC